jgi:hypothetical protein
METLRQHGTHRLSKVWQWAINSNVSTEFEQRGAAVSRLIAALEQRLALGDTSVRKEPDLWSKRSVPSCATGPCLLSPVLKVAMKTSMY